MTGVLARLAAAVLVLAAGSSTVDAADGDEVGQRVAASAAAAEAFAGPLDGRWVLVDSAERTLFVVELTSPAGGRPLEGAWRSPLGEEGVLERVALRPGRLAFRLDGLAVTLAEHGGVWRGGIRRRGALERVTLRR